MSASEENPLNQRIEIHCRKDTGYWHIFNNSFPKHKTIIARKFNTYFFCYAGLIAVREISPKYAIKTIPKFQKSRKIEYFILFLMCANNNENK